MNRGDTFLLPAGPQRWPHLWIVVTDPHFSTTETVVVSVTTLRNSADQTLVLRRGDHPFIQHDSVVHYEDSRSYLGSQIDSLIDSGEVQRHYACTYKLIDEIEAGLRNSPFTPQKVLRFLEENQ